ncbi:MAG: hypothetical protein KAG06_07630 [Methylococcales bacterium]|nr:hypothetical protein [Methylococcales bacterium]
MTLTTQQVWQEAYQRLMLVDKERPVSEETVDNFLAGLPKRLFDESLLSWIKRGQKLNKILSFPTLKFRYLTDIQRLAADTRETQDALPEKSLLSGNKQFRLTLQVLADNKLRLKIEALNLASSRYAHRLIGIAANNSKDDLITVIRLDEDGEGIDDTLENSPIVRQALLRPVIALIE